MCKQGAQQSFGIDLKELGGGSDVELVEIVHRNLLNLNLKPIFTQK